MLSTDVGSIPFGGDFDRLDRGARVYDSLLPLLHGPGSTTYAAAEYFETQVINGMAGKIKAGIAIPNYPQFRDMNEAFLQNITGIEKGKQGWTQTGSIKIRSDRLKIPEVEAIIRNCDKIYELVNRPLQMKICLTGPYTLASLFPSGHADLIASISGILCKFAAQNTHSSKKVRTSLVSIDEPVLGFLGDSTLDHGSEGREVLTKAWDGICHEARTRGAETLMHLHNTSTDLFWEVDDLVHIESHVGDDLYRSKEAKSRCEEVDKFIRASIAVTDFDSLIRQAVQSQRNVSEADASEVTAKTWSEILRGSVDPINFLETDDVMRKRLQMIVELFGSERVKFAGPECGLKSFPTSECAFECLRRAARVTAAFQT